MAISGLLTDEVGAKRPPPPLPKICHIYPTMMKHYCTVIPYLRKTQKNNNHVTHPLSSADIRIFLPEISKFCYIKKYRLHFHTYFLILLTFLESLKIVLIKIVTILMMLAKMATPSFLKITVFSNKNYEVIISVHDVIKKTITWFKLFCRCGHVTKVW